jgi:hypothetical protein
MELIPSWEVASSSAIQEFLTFHGTRSFSTVSTGAFYCCLLWVRWIWSTSFHPISLKSILILSSVYAFFEINLSYCLVECNFNFLLSPSKRHLNPKGCVTLCNKLDFYGEHLSVPRLSPKLKCRPLSDVLLSIFAYLYTVHTVTKAISIHTDIIHSYIYLYFVIYFL